MDKASVSIIVPIYNVEKYLPACLDSILAQTYSAWECILVDDGSKDNSPTIIDEYCAKDFRFKAIHKENEGANYARRDGVSYVTASIPSQTAPTKTVPTDTAAAQAQADPAHTTPTRNTPKWITFVDSDDTIDPTYLEVLVNAAEENDADITWTGFRRVDEQGQVIEEKELSFERYVLTEKKKSWTQISKIVSYAAIVCGRIFASKLFENIDWEYSNVLVGEDGRLLLQLVNRSRALVQTPTNLYDYLIRAQSATHSSRSFGIDEINNQYDTYKRAINNSNKSERLKLLMENYLATVLIVMLNQISDSNDWRNPTKHVLRDILIKEYNSLAVNPFMRATKKRFMTLRIICFLGTTAYFQIKRITNKIGYTYKRI
jgi:glycosyltransferase involved in cell wall biosynthesis